MGEDVILPIVTPSPSLPASSKSQYTQDPDKIKYLTQKELSSLFQIVKKSSSRDYALILISFYHGLRISEVGMLQLSDYDEEGQRIKLHRAKGGFGFQYKLADECVSALKKWILIRGKEPGPLFPSRRSKLQEGELGIAKRTLHGLFVEYCKLAKIPEDKWHFHTLRHTCGVTMVERLIPMTQIKDWLGHKIFRDRSLCKG